MDGIRAKTLREATGLSLQLRARGTSRWAVAERKEEIGRNDTWRVVDELGSRGFGCSNRQQRDPSGGNPDRRASSVAVTDASALSRLAVAALFVVVGVSGCHGSVYVAGRCLNDSQATMHCAGVQLCRLGQTYGEPGRKHTGENARDQVTAHGENIRRSTPTTKRVDWPSLSLPEPRPVSARRPEPIR